MIGYKAFDKDLKCNDVQYVIGELTTVEQDSTTGSYFCEELLDCFKYYNMGESTRICKVVATDSFTTVSCEGDTKIVANELHILKELTKEEIEAIIATDSYSSYAYARTVIKGEWLPGEDAIATDAYYSYQYATNVIKSPFKAGEATIAKDEYYNHFYERHNF